MSKKISIDVMKGESFYKTLTYDYNPLFRFDHTELERCLRWVTDELPSLKTAKDATLYIKLPDGNEKKVFLNYK